MAGRRPKTGGGVGTTTDVHGKTHLNGVSVEQQRAAERSAEYAASAREGSKQGLSNMVSDTDALLDAHAVVVAEEQLRQYESATKRVREEEARTSKEAADKFGVPVEVEIDMSSITRLLSEGGWEDVDCDGKMRIKGESLEIDVHIKQSAKYADGDVFVFYRTAFSYKPSFFSKRRNISSPEELKSALADHRRRNK